MKKMSKEEVLKDMNHEDGHIAETAREYYKEHYATEEELKKMESEDEHESHFAMLMFCIPCLLLIIGIMCIMMGYTR